MTALLFRDDVSDESIADFVNRVRAPRYRRRAIIDSRGGSSRSVMESASAIRSCGLTTIADEVASAAIHLFALGEHRVAHVDSTFFFHQMTLWESGSGRWLTVDELQTQAWLATELGSPMRFQYRLDAAYLQAMRVATLDLLVEATGTDRGVFISLMEQEVTLTASEALRLNLVHRIAPAAQINDMLRAA